ncbi:MAG: SsrA-binding protein SmpB [Deltaproteobacteria bacterium]|nr:SsrA-binding protein SmpB [Deltaproteobacteria bacterium]
MKIICQNKQVGFKYQLTEKFEAGIILLGPEVKSLREGKANLRESYAVFKGEELYLLNCHITPYKNARVEELDPKRNRKLLLHKTELERLLGKIKEKGLTLVPTKMYFNEKGRAKVEIALAKGKTGRDKRDTIKKREADRELRRVLKKHS